MKRGLILAWKFAWLVPLAVLLVAFIWAGWFVQHHSLAVLSADGVLADRERNLLILASIMSVIVVVPVFGLTIFIALKYREGRKKPARYEPDFDRSKLFETIWWGIPIIIIGILSVVAWQSAHSLDPYKPLDANRSDLTVQVVALDWKWLFIYPEQRIASVNLAPIPTDQPVNFVVTSDTIMNSFWVPALGGQIYAMPGMATQLHEQTSKAGDYFGSPANIAGKGFARMDFTVRAMPPKDFTAWANQTKQGNRMLTTASYQHLAQPSYNVAPRTYAWVPVNFFNDLVMKYMQPGASESPNLQPSSHDRALPTKHGTMPSMSGMNMGTGQ